MFTLIGIGTGSSISIQFGNVFPDISCNLKQKGNSFILKQQQLF
jgi:hypothetical protein